MLPWLLAGDVCHLLGCWNPDVKEWNCLKEISLKRSIYLGSWDLKEDRGICEPQIK